MVGNIKLVLGFTHNIRLIPQCLDIVESSGFKNVSSNDRHKGCDVEGILVTMLEDTMTLAVAAATTGSVSNLFATSSNSVLLTNHNDD